MSRRVVVAMTALGLTGVTVAAARSTSNPFAVASLSRLGLDARAGSVMNLTLVAEGVIMLDLASSFRTRLAVLRRTGGLTLQGERLMVAGFAVAGAALGLTGFFTVQDPGSTVVHNVGGFAAPIALTATLVAAGLLIRGLGRPVRGRRILGQGCISIGGLLGHAPSLLDQGSERRPNAARQCSSSPSSSSSCSSCSTAG